MNVFNLAIASAIVLSSCSEEAGFPELKPGTYYLEIFNDKGEKVLTRRGEAIGLGSYSQIRFEDPEFITKYSESPYATFAYLLLTTGNENEVWDQGKLWPMNSQSQAMLNQHYYNLHGDWAYENVSGELVITESTARLLKGYFTMSMTVLPIDSKWGIRWSVNPQWGEHIIVKGYFESRGW
ncbi:MAG TPA: hypothetical protein VGK59_08205 [Ohtaekwangia sp.]